MARENQHSTTADFVGSHIKMGLGGCNFGVLIQIQLRLKFNISKSDIQIEKGSIFHAYSKYNPRPTNIQTNTQIVLEKRFAAMATAYYIMT